MRKIIERRMCQICRWAELQQQQRQQQRRVLRQTLLPGAIIMIPIKA
jgi:hypothetical protein